MYRPGTWALDSFHSYTSGRVRDPGSDNAKSEFEIERGQSERLGLEIGLETTRARRDKLQLDRMGFAVRGLAVESPVEVALEGAWAPSLLGREPEWETEAEAITNLGDRWSVVFQYSGEIEAGRRLEHKLIVGPLCRFGLQGLAGLHAVYAAEGAFSLQATVGGAVSRRVFLAVTPRAGLTRRAPDAALMVELHAVFGPYALGAWGLR